MEKNLSKREQGSATTWERIRSLKLSHKLALSYTVAFTILLGITFTIIYLAVENFREEDFYHRLKNSTLSRYKMFVQVDEIDVERLKLFDKSIVRNTSEWQILLFDSSGSLLYNSVDENNIGYAHVLLRTLKEKGIDIEYTKNKYQYVASRFLHNGKTYFGVAKGYDGYGINKLEFLKILLIVSFFIVAGILVILSFYLSRIITSPVTMLTKDIGLITPDNLSVRVRSPQVKDEIGFLANKFNEMLDKVEGAFKFQHHFIHHLSHELKTPLAVMLANVERSMLEGDEKTLKSSLLFQKNALMELSNIINSMMDISKSETQLANVLTDTIRIDELLFECMDEINFLNNEAQFDFVVDESIHKDESLTVTGNGRMLKMAIMNVLKNAINFSAVKNPQVELSANFANIQIRICNDGLLISEKDRAQLFKHLFRGENSKGIKGFGLGLVLTHRIIALHKGEVKYCITENNHNCFNIQLPLAY